MEALRFRLLNLHQSVDEKKGRLDGQVKRNAILGAAPEPWKEKTGGAAGAVANDSDASWVHRVYPRKYRGFASTLVPDTVDPRALPRYMLVDTYLLW